MLLVSRPGGYAGINAAVYYPELFDRLRRVPGVQSVSAGDTIRFLPPPDQTVKGGDAAANVQEFLIAPGFFRTLEIPLVAGREFSFRQTSSSDAVAVISASLARHLFGATDAIGRRIVLLGQPDKTLAVVGVTQDSAAGSLQRPNPMQLFLSSFQQDGAALYPYVLVRTLGPPGRQITERLRSEVEAMGREYPLRMETMDSAISRALVQERMMATLAGALGLLSLLLAGMGVYGLVSYSVERRTCEVGVRIALGASPGAVLRMLFRELLIPVFAGFVLTAPAVYAGGKLIRAMLYGIDPLNAWVLGGSMALLAFVAALAVYVPARRAANLEPMRALGRE